IILALDGHRKRRDLTFGHIISPAFYEFQCTVLFEDHSGRFGVLFVDFTIASRDSRNKSIDIGHDAFLRRSIADRPCGADCVGTSEMQSVSGAVKAPAGTLARYAIWKLKGWFRSKKLKKFASARRDPIRPIDRHSRCNGYAIALIASLVVTTTA